MVASTSPALSWWVKGTFACKLSVYLHTDTPVSPASQGVNWCPSLRQGCLSLSSLVILSPRQPCLPHQLENIPCLSTHTISSLYFLVYVLLLSLQLGSVSISSVVWSSFVRFSIFLLCCCFLLKGACISFHLPVITHSHHSSFGAFLPSVFLFLWTVTGTIDMIFFFLVTSRDAPCTGDLVFPESFHSDSRLWTKCFF